MTTTTSYRPLTKNTKGLIFAIVLFLFELMTCFIYGFRFSYNPNYQNTYVQGDVVLVVVLTILAIVGFALMNTYITNASFTGMAMSLLIFAITLQHWFFFRAFWYKAGTSRQDAVKSFVGDYNYNRVSFTNIDKDTYVNDTLPAASFADAIACAICMILTFSPVVGRIQFLQAFFMTLFGSFFYEVNSQLFFRLRIRDCGFGMRLFLFAGVMGLVSALILGKKDTTVNHGGYYSNYSTRGLALLGFIFTFCAFPYLAVSELYHTSTNNGYITYIAPLNMYFALGAGVLGSFAINALTYRKIHTFDLIYTGLSGGIFFSSSADVHRNPGIPIACGFIMGMIATLWHSRLFRKGNANGVIFSLGVVNRLILPGVFAGILSAVLEAIAQGSVGSYIHYKPTYRSFIGQGAFQLIGILLAVGIALLAGAIIGLLYKIINKNKVQHQFNDNLLYFSDEDHEHTNVQRSWKEIE